MNSKISPAFPCLQAFQRVLLQSKLPCTPRTFFPNTKRLFRSSSSRKNRSKRRSSVFYDCRTRTLQTVLRQRDLWSGRINRDLTNDLVVKLKETTSLDPSPHLTCVCHQEDEIHSIIERYAASGVSNILALGGDPPHNLADYDRSQDAFEHAAGLVKFIKKFNETGAHPDPRGFGIGVAAFPEGHPTTPNRLKEMDYLKAKVDAGADYIVTQLFFDNHDFHDFRIVADSPESTFRSSPESCLS